MSGPCVCVDYIEGLHVAIGRAIEHGALNRGQVESIGRRPTPRRPPSFPRDLLEDVPLGQYILPFGHV